MKKPGIIVLSDDHATNFDWMSDGWNTADKSDTKEAKVLFTKAKRCISDGSDVPDVIRRLEKAGFKVTRSHSNPHAPAGVI